MEQPRTRRACPIESPSLYDQAFLLPRPAGDYIYVLHALQRRAPAQDEGPDPAQTIAIHEFQEQRNATGARCYRSRTTPAPRSFSDRLERVREPRAMPLSTGCADIASSSSVALPSSTGALNHLATT